jgi:hypothetical protein
MPLHAAVGVADGAGKCRGKRSRDIAGLGYDPQSRSCLLSEINRPSWKKPGETVARLVCVQFPGIFVIENRILPAIFALVLEISAPMFSKGCRPERQISKRFGGRNELCLT